MNEHIEARRAFYGDKPLEMRVRPFEVRDWFDDATGNGGVGLTGYASTVNEPYAVRDWLGEYQETIMPGAFTKALQERDDVRLLVNHEGIPIARTKSGTMSLREDDHGLLVEVPHLDGDSPLVQTVRSAMQRGDVDEMSFSFKATRQEWNEDYTERYVREVKLYDVSVVTYPANPGTNVKLRGGLTVSAVRRIGNGEPLTDADMDALRALYPDLVARNTVAEDETARLARQERRLAAIKALAASL